MSGFNWTFNNLNNVILPGLSEDPQDLATLLTWHNNDVPDNYEIARNDFIQSKQFNRNPFIDHPEWVSYINFGTLTYQTPAAAQMQQGMQKTMESAVKTQLILWPNPTAGDANLTVDSSVEDIVQLRIYDLTGKLLSQVQSPVMMGTTTIPLGIDALATGFYVVKIEGRLISEEIKFRKQ